MPTKSMVDESIELLLGAEAKHATAIQQHCSSYLALANDFKCFFMETSQLLSKESHSGARIEAYNLFVLRAIHSFKSLCAADKLAFFGYPYHGFVLLRNLFNDLVLTSAALGDLKIFYHIQGIQPEEKPDNIDLVTKLRRKTEREMQSQMIGSKSKLSQSTIDELKRIKMTFNWETHASLFSLIQAVDSIKEAGGIYPLPTFEQKAIAFFISRFCQVGWMTHRILPPLQLSSTLFPDDWRRKWHAIDERFCAFVKAYPKTGAAMDEFISAKFPFDEHSVFPHNA